MRTVVVLCRDIADMPGTSPGREDATRLLRGAPVRDYPPIVVIPNTADSRPTWRYQLVDGQARLNAARMQGEPLIAAHLAATVQEATAAMADSSEKPLYDHSTLDLIERMNLLHHLHRTQMPPQRSLRAWAVRDGREAGQGRRNRANRFGSIVRGIMPGASLSRVELVEVMANKYAIGDAACRAFIEQACEDIDAGRTSYNTVVDRLNPAHPRYYRRARPRTAAEQRDLAGRIIAQAPAIADAITLLLDVPWALTPDELEQVSAAVTTARSAAHLWTNHRPNLDKGV